MKNNLKFVVAVMGITIATFGSMDVKAYGSRSMTYGGPNDDTTTTFEPASGGGVCTSYGFCGTAQNGAAIEGQFHSR